MQTVKTLMITDLDGNHIAFAAALDPEHGSLEVDPGPDDAVSNRTEVLSDRSVNIHGPIAESVSTKT